MPRRTPLTEQQRASAAERFKKADATFHPPRVRFAERVTLKPLPDGRCFVMDGRKVFAFFRRTDLAEAWLCGARSTLDAVRLDV